MRRHGFALPELLVGLVLTGLILLAGARALTASLDGWAAIENAGERTLREGVRRAWLVRAVRSLQVGVPGSVPFVGTADAVEFSASVYVPGGWREVRRVRLELQGQALVASVGGEPPLLLAPGLRGVHFDYLVNPGLDSRWVDGWQSPASAPLAVRLRLYPRALGEPADTLVLLIGGRG